MTLDLVKLAKMLDALNTFDETARRVSKRRALEPIEKGLTQGMAAAFRAQGQAIVAELAKLKDEFPVEEAAPPLGGESVWAALFRTAELATLDLLREPLVEAAQAGLLAGAENVIGSLDMGISYTLKNPRALAYVKSVGADKVTKINETTRGRIKSLLEQAVDEGWSYNRTAKSIISEFEDFAVGKPQLHIDSRAHFVAVTEVGNAYEAGNAAVVADLADGGLAMEKFWSTMNDDRVSAGCRANQDEGWIPADQAHSTGHMHPLEHPGCRCDELYRRKM